MGTVNGKPVGDEQIRAWADEAKRGYDADMLRRRGRRPLGEKAAESVTVQFDETALAAIDRVALERQTDRSKISRDAVVAYLR